MMSDPCPLCPKPSAPGPRGRYLKGADKANRVRELEEKLAAARATIRRMRKRAAGALGGL